MLTRLEWIQKHLTKCQVEYGYLPLELVIPYDDYMALIEELNQSYVIDKYSDGFMVLNVMGVQIVPKKGLWSEEEDNDRLIEEYEQKTTGNR